MPLGFKQRRDEAKLRCSFCRKSHDVAGQLISNPSDYPRAYICNECIAVCARVVLDKEDPIEGNPLLSEFLDATERWLACERGDSSEAECLTSMRELAHRMFDS